MADGTFPRPLSGLLHELAEGLQSAGTYLSAAHRISTHNACQHASTPDMIDKAAGEIMRVPTAFHRPRDHLRSDWRYEKDATSAPLQTGADQPVIGRETSEIARLIDADHESTRGDLLAFAKHFRTRDWVDAGALRFSGILSSG